MGFPATHEGIEDWVIGEPDEDFVRLASGDPQDDADDFILGDEQEILSLVNHRSRRQERATRGDLRTISDLIAEELGQPDQDEAAETAPTVEQAARFEKPSIRDVLLDLGEDGHTAQVALSIAQRISPEIFRLAEFKSFPTADREILVESLCSYSAQVKEQQTILQDLIAQYIRQGEFQRVAAIDAVKRKLDELLLQIRVLQNRISSKGAELVPGTYVDGTSAEELYDEAQEDSSTFNTKKAKAKAKVEKSSRKSFNPKIPRVVKFAFILLLVAMMPIGYYLSANWGVEKVVHIDVMTYKKVLPLVSASGSKDAFHGIVADNWKKLDKKAKEDAMRQLGAMAKVDGYQTIFLMYASNGIAAIYNVDKERLVVQ